MPSFISTQMKLANVKFINAVKKHECIWKKEAQGYNDKQLMQIAWNEVARENGDSVRTCIVHWQKLRGAYATSIKVNSKRPNKKYNYYLSDALEFLRPYIITKSDTVTSKTSNIDIKDKPAESMGNDKLAEQLIFDIVEIENEEVPRSDAGSNESYVICISDNETEERCDKKQLKVESESKPEEGNKSIADANKMMEVPGEEDFGVPVHPSISMANSNRLFFESLIPFVNCMTPQQNRQFRRDVMCLIDDVLDNKDIDKNINC